jgi:hypothetical protein
VNFGPFWVILGVFDVTKGVKILKSCFSDIIISFATLKNFTDIKVADEEKIYDKGMQPNI